MTAPFCTAEFDPRAEGKGPRAMQWLKWPTRAGQAIRAAACVDGLCLHVRLLTWWLCVMDGHARRRNENSAYGAHQMTGNPSGTPSSLMSLVCKRSPRA